MTSFRNILPVSNFITEQEGSFTSKNTLLYWRDLPSPPASALLLKNEGDMGAGSEPRQMHKRESRAFNWAVQPIFPQASSCPLHRTLPTLSHSKEPERQAQCILAEQMPKQHLRDPMRHWEAAWRKSPAYWTYPCRCWASNRETNPGWLQWRGWGGGVGVCVLLDSSCGTCHGTEIWRDKLGFNRLELEFWLCYLSVCNLRQVWPPS